MVDYCVEIEKEEIKVIENILVSRIYYKSKKSNLSAKTIVSFVRNMMDRMDLEIYNELKKGLYFKI